MLCDVCNAEIVREPEPIGTGYGRNDAGQIVCYGCCGRADAKALDSLPIGGVMYLYCTQLDLPGGSYRFRISNWPGSFKLTAFGRKSTGGGGFGADRVDVWFRFRGKQYWGVNRGYSEVCRVQRVKT